MTRNVTFLALAICGLSASACSQEPAADRSAAPLSPATTPAPAPAPSSTLMPEVLSCSWPVKEGDTAEDLIERFGKTAQRAQLDGPEGTTMPGLVLWGDDPARRIEVMFNDEAAADRIAGWRIADGSRWAFADLRIGDDLRRVMAVNGAAFRLYGFAWDYGGYVTDWKGGKLDKLPGKCGISVRLSPIAEELPSAVMGDGEIASDAAAVVEVGARVSEISVGFGGEE